MTLKDLFKKLFFSHNLIFDSKKNSIIILVYHNVQNTEQFKKHISYYKKKFDIVSLNEAVRLLSENKNFDSKLVITFDDGYNNLLPMVKNITKEIPICIFLSTYYIENSDFFWWEIFRLMARKNKKISKNLFQIVNALEMMPQEKRDTKIEELIKIFNIKKNDYIHYEKYSPLTWTNIIEMKKYNVDFQAHGHHHYVMSNLSINALNEEVQCNKKIIEKNLSSQCLHFAYPGGYFNNKTIEILQENDFISAVTDNYGINTKATNLFMLNRIGISDNDSIPMIAMKLFGLWKYIHIINDLTIQFLGGGNENCLDK
jgi:peptidoglycan/xylan/chitin deacetylase (PgdA/CDA1 family)